MYHPATRLLTVLELLQANERLSGRELAERLEVSVRTVRHYVTLIQDLGIPVEAERGRYGAYRLHPGFKLPPLMFSEEEAVAVTLGLLTARRMGLAATTPAVEAALAKLQRVLPSKLRTRVQAIQDTLVLDLPPPEATPQSAIVITYSAAVHQSRQLFIRYQAAVADTTERLIDPYGLVYRDGRWYGVGYCHLRAGIRMFRLDRLRQTELRDTTFTRPPEFDPLQYVLNSLANKPGPWPVEVLIKTTIDRARQQVPPTIAGLEATAEGVVLRCSARHLRWMARFLVSLGYPVVVRKPPELRNALRQLALETLSWAEATDEQATNPA